MRRKPGMAWMGRCLFAALLLLMLNHPAMGTNPSGKYWTPLEEGNRTESVSYSLTATSTLGTQAFAVPTKSVQVTNEGTQSIRVSVDGDTITSTSGTRLTASQILKYEHFRTTSMTYIAVTTHSVSFQVEVNY